MLKKFIHENPVAVSYARDGLLTAAALNIAATNHNLFAMRLGADDYQLSLVQFMPQMFNLLVLIPGGLFINSLCNKRRMVIIMLLAVALGYLLCGLSPFAPARRVYFFLAFLSLSAGSFSWYHISWQSFFPEVVEGGKRNRVLALRGQMEVSASMLVPLLAGSVLAYIGTDSGKIAAHQGFYFCAALLFILTALNFRRFETVLSAAHRVSFAEIKKSWSSLPRNKPFILFAATAVFFYLTWHIDWTLYYIGQVRYLRLNELQLGMVTAGATAAQFLTMRFWSRRNEKHGVVLPVAFGILGLSLCPLSMICAVSLPAAIGPTAFIIFHMAANMTLATITLNMFQCLLQVAGEEYRSFSISVYACLICLSNAVMPVAGVALYRALGGDLNGLRCTYWIVFALRIIAAGLWLLRCRLIGKKVPT